MAPGAFPAHPFPIARQMFQICRNNAFNSIISGNQYDPRVNALRCILMVALRARKELAAACQKLGHADNRRSSDG
jgi:hypothetical protein